jgi:serine/threonine protein kinase
VRRKQDKNVLLDVTGRARVCDFGLCHNLSTGQAKGKSGTKGFFAPEQLKGKECECDSLANESTPANSLCSTL